jgi:hypothetical protein
MTSKARLLALAATLGIALTSFDAASQQPAGGDSAQAPAKEPTKEQKEEAASRFRKGFELFKEADYQAALIEFRRAYELAPNYNVLYNIGQVYFQLQDYANALSALERYLAEGGKNVSKQRREEVDKDIEKLRSRVANLDVTANVTDVEIAIDDIPQGRTPLPKPILVSAGRHKITATKEGYRPITRIVEVASSDSLKIPLELVEQKAGSPTPPPDTTGTIVPPVPTTTATTPPPVTKPPEEPPGIPWAGWAITGGFAAGAVITGVLALSASSDLADSRAAPGVSRATLDEMGSKVSTMALVSDILSGCAVVAGGVSLILTIRSLSAAPAESGQPASDARASSGIQNVRLNVLPGGASVSGSF